MFKSPQSRNGTKPVFHQRGAMLESLETRRLLSATVSGLLTVDGTNGNDEITIEIPAANPNRLRVTVNDEVDTFRLSRIDRIRVRGLDGNDTITVEDGNGLELEGTIRGNDGDDTIVGGNGDKTLRGGDGNDEITGGDLDDLVIGGPGTDVLTGGDGEDVFPLADEEEVTDLGLDDGIEVSLSDLPAAARAVINHERGDNPVEGLFREVDEGVTVYEAEWTEKKYDRSLKLRNNGIVVEDEREIDIENLPDHIRDAVLDRYADAEFEEAEFGNARGFLFYEVEIDSGDEHRELVIDLDGDIREDELEP